MGIQNTLKGAFEFWEGVSQAGGSGGDNTYQACKRYVQQDRASKLL